MTTSSKQKKEHTSESDTMLAVARSVSNSSISQETEQELQRRADTLAESIYKFVNKLAEGKKRIKEQIQDIIDLGKKARVDNEKLGKLLRDAFHKRGVSDSYVRQIMPPELRVSSHTNLRYLPDSSEHEISNNSYASVLPNKGKLNDARNTLEQQIESKKQNPYAKVDLKPHTIYQVEDSVSPPQSSEPMTQDVDSLTEEIKNLKHEIVIKSKQIQRYENDLDNLKRELKEAKHFLKEDTFVARAYMTLGDNDVPIRVVVNIANKEIESAEIDNEALKSAIMRAK